jgi:hypothetical protein
VLNLFIILLFSLLIETALCFSFNRSRFFFDLRLGLQLSLLLDIGALNNKLLTLYRCKIFHFVLLELVVLEHSLLWLYLLLVVHHLRISLVWVVLLHLWHHHRIITSEACCWIHARMKLLSVFIGCHKLVCVSVILDTLARIFKICIHNRSSVSHVHLVLIHFIWVKAVIYRRHGVLSIIWLLNHAWHSSIPSGHGIISWPHPHSLVVLHPWSHVHAHRNSSKLIICLKLLLICWRRVCLGCLCGLGCLYCRFTIR